MSYEIYAAFAKRLRQICDGKGLPERGRQAELARVCNVKPSSVNKWFNAVSLPDAKNLLIISKWANTSVDWLLDGTRSPTPISASTQALEIAKAFDRLTPALQSSLIGVIEGFGEKVQRFEPESILIDEDEAKGRAGGSADVKLRQKQSFGSS